MFEDELLVDSTFVSLDAPTPNAEVTYNQLEAALTNGRWSHDVPGIELWLNTSFAPHGHTAVTLSGELEAHGVAILP